MQPRPFEVRIPDPVIDDLRTRLLRTRFPDEAPGAPWSYGTSLDYLRELVDYWRDRFPFGALIERLNHFAQFTVPLAGIELHYLHEEGRGPRPLPLLLSHGWPGTPWEFAKLIPLLTDPAAHGGDAADAFTVIAPSLPGFAFSFAPGQPRFGVIEIADAFAQLVTQVLGYPRFAAHGGDFGAAIARRLALTHPERLTALHLTLHPQPREQVPDDLSNEERAYLDECAAWEREETGYNWIQGTRPQTLAYGLTDSPAGLLAWLLEKYRAWSDCGGDVERSFSKDELLAVATIYWATGAINSSFWPYYARRHGPREVPEGKRIEVPTAYALFPREIRRPPRTWLARSYDLRRYTAMERGGHFAALEEPEALANDLRTFFRDHR